MDFTVEIDTFGDVVVDTFVTILELEFVGRVAVNLGNTLFGAFGLVEELVRTVVVFVVDVFSLPAVFAEVLIDLD